MSSCGDSDWQAGAPQLQDYDYDALNRLTSWQLNTDPAETYGYDATTGNLATKAGVAYSYNDGAHKHAVTDVGTSNDYSYDAKGNMIKRVLGSQVFAFSYDAENRLVKVCQDTNSNGACDTGETVIASFIYDADGNRVQSTIGSTTTTFVGNYYEVTGSIVTKYYYAGSSRIAMSVGGTVSYLLSDQLGSTSITANGSGGFISELRYRACPLRSAAGVLREGEVRYTSGTTPTKYTYTGQYSNMADFGLMFYNARWYDPTIGRFVQADSVVAGGRTRGRTRRITPSCLPQMRIEWFYRQRRCMRI